MVDVWKLVPVMVTRLPPAAGPEDGEMFVIVGTAMGIAYLRGREMGKELPEMIL